MELSAVVIFLPDPVPITDVIVRELDVPVPFLSVAVPIVYALHYAIKQLERTKKNLELKLKKLNDTSRKDDVVTFEELGVDRLFVDEADFYKNLFLYTKMRNVAGLAQTEAQKSSDLFAKCRYLDELTEGRGVVLQRARPFPIP